MNSIGNANIKWLFFDVGSTIIDEHVVYEKRMKEIAHLANITYEDSAEEGIKKPDREIFEIALSRANCKLHEAFMIGDRIDNDIVPAKQLGMHTIWVRQGFGKYWRIEHEFERAEFVENNLAEICKIM